MTVMLVTALLGALAIVFATFFLTTRRAPVAIRSKPVPIAAPLPVREPLQEPSQTWYEQLAALQLRFNSLEGRVTAMLDQSEQNFRKARAAEERNRVRLARFGESDDDPAVLFDPRQMQIMPDDEPEPAPVPMSAREARLEQRRSRVAGP